MKWYKRLKALLMYRKAVDLADKVWAETGERQYVMPMGRKLVVMGRKEFRELKMKGYIGQRVRVFDLDRECFYATPYRDGERGKYPKEVIKIKKDQWLDYALNNQR